MTANGDIVQKLWSLSSVLRDDGMVYHQYMTELTYLLFLKIASETGAERALPEGCRWGDLMCMESEDLLGFYRKMLTHLGEDAPSDEVREIFAFPTTVFKHATNLRIVVDRINGLEWYSARRDGFGDIYEGLLEKNAVESKSGAGQYFTPRALVDSIVSLSKPQGGEVVQDPAAGTGGFLVSADGHARGVSGGTPGLYQGIEIVKDTYRLCLMNLFVHGMEAKLINGDALSNDHQLLDPAVILTNPPFGARGAGGSPRRSDLSHPTSNKQLMFVQHIYRGLRNGGRAAVVVPDNVLLDSNAAQRIRTDLMDECDLHTILRLPSGIFYSAGVKTNVLFFTRRQSIGDNSHEVWVYDARTNVPPFGKRNPLDREFFAEFERCFGGDPHGRDRNSSRARGVERWRSFSRDELSARSDNLDIGWLREDSRPENGLAEADEIAAEILSNLSTALTEVEAITHLLAAAHEA